MFNTNDKKIRKTFIKVTRYNNDLKYSRLYLCKHTTAFLMKFDIKVILLLAQNIVRFLSYKKD